jgi:hypothetical protein
VTAERPYDPAIGWEPLTIELEQGGAIEGIVRDRSGAGVPRAVVAANDFFGSPRTIHADGAGRFHFAHLRAGDYEVRVVDTMIDTRVSWSAQLSAEAGEYAPQSNCTVVSGRTSQCDLQIDRCRLVVAVQASGFSLAGWRVFLESAHSGPSSAEGTFGNDGTCTMTAGSTGLHLLRLLAPGGPLGNVFVQVELDLVAGEQRCELPLALAPFAAKLSGRMPTDEPPSFYLRAKRSGAFLSTSLHVDPATGAFAAPLAPVGDVVLQQGSVDIGRFVVPASR